MENIMNYKNIANNDYEFLSEAIDKAVGSGEAPLRIPSLASEICEKYLKHIISEYCHPETNEEMYIKEKILHSHSLRNLLDYIENAGFEVSDDTRDKIIKIDGLYFNTRYPSEDFHITTFKDIKDSKDAMDEAKKYVAEIETKISESEK